MMSVIKPKILVVGSLVLDVITKTTRVPEEGETLLSGIDSKTAPGGKGANQAVQAARLGSEVTMVGRVGKDIFGEQLLLSLTEANVNIDKVKVDDGTGSAVGNVIIEVDEEGNSRNRIIVYPGANMKIVEKDVEFLKDEIGKYDMLLLQFEIPMEINALVSKFAYDKGVPVMLNPAPSAEVPVEMFSKLKYIAPNEHEAYDLTGIEIQFSKDDVDMDDLEKASTYFLDKGVENVIITLGSKGVFFRNKEESIYEPAEKIDKAVDPTAAGDSFIGAFSTGICMGMSNLEALRFAKKAAAITVSRMGAQPSLPGIDEVIL